MNDKEHLKLVLNSIYGRYSYMSGGYTMNYLHNILKAKDYVTFFAIIIKDYLRKEYHISLYYRGEITYEVIVKDEARALQIKDEWETMDEVLWKNYKEHKLSRQN